MSRSFKAFPDFLAYYFFEGCQAESTNKIFFSYFANLPLNWISVLTYYFFEGCQAEWTSIFLLNLAQLLFLTYVFSILTYYFFEGCQAEST